MSGPNCRDDPPGSPPKVSIVILNWNHYQATYSCLDSLSKIIYPNYDVIVVDNGSDDSSGHQLAREFDHRFIFSEYNRGFAGGCNLGIQTALDGGASYVLLLNNDVCVKPDFLDHLVKVSKDDDSVAGVGGIIYDHSGEIWFAGGKFNKHLCRGTHETSIRCDHPYETEYITGALFLLSCDFLKEDGKFDENYFFGMEDLDMGIRAKSKGWKLMMAPQAEVVHKVSSSAGLKSPFKYYHATRNRLYLASKEFNTSQRAVFYLIFLITRILRVGQWVLSVRTQHIRAIIEGMFDHITNKSFKRPEHFDPK